MRADITRGRKPSGDRTAKATPPFLGQGLSLEALQRITTREDFLPELDGLRFLSIVFVLIAHISSSFQVKALPNQHEGLFRVLENGSNGVRIFFAISGFILAYPFMTGRRLAYRHYFIRRLSRLEPPYLVSLGIYAAVIALVKGAVPLAHLACSGLYAHLLVYKTSSPINHVTWSLEIEVQYYLLFPCLLAGFQALDQRFGAWAANGGLLLLAVLGVTYQAHPLLPVYTVGDFISYFLVGFLAANALRGGHLERLRFLPGPLVTGTSLLICLGLFLVDVRAHSVRNCVLFLGALFGLMALLVVPRSGFRSLLTQRFVYVTGGMCYSIYLYHPLILSGLGVSAVIQAFPANLLGLGLYAMVALGLIWGVACGLFLLLEKPFMVKGWQRGQGRLRAYYGALWIQVKASLGPPSNRVAPRTEISSDPRLP